MLYKTYVAEPIDMPLKNLIFGVLLIVLVTLVVYTPAMRAGFVWDDNKFLTDNALIKAEDGLYRFWCTTEAPDYFPLTSTTLWLEWRLWEMNAAGYHAVNVILHVLNSVLIWLVLIRLKVPGAWLAGLIFAVHPVNVESVAWITERKNVLPMTFYALSILLYLRFESNGRRWWYGLSLGSFLLALLGKTSVVMQPFVLLGCAWWQRHKIGGRDLLRSVPFFALAGILGLVTVWFQYNRAIGEDIVRADSFFSRLAVAGKAVWFYLHKAVFPHKLSFVYPRWELDEVTIVSFLPGLLLAGLMMLLWSYRKSWARPLLFGVGYYVVTLFPVLGFFNIYFMKYSLVADHWQYISIIGIIALLVGMGSSAYRHRQSIFRHSAIIAAVAIVCIFSLHSWRLGHSYKNIETLWRHTIAKNPQCWMAHNNLATELKKQGRLDQAINHYQEALRIKPDFEEAFYNLGNALAAQGRHDVAVKYYYEALRLKPDAVEVHINLGNALAAQGKYDRATGHYHEALRIRPDFEEAHYNIGNALADQGKTAEAVKYYYEALRLKPDFEEAHYRVGNAMIEQGKMAEAINHFNEVLRINPDSVDAQISLGNIFSAQGNTDEAISHYSRALQVRPDYAEVHNNLGAALIRKRKVEEAIVHFQEALRIRPDYVDALNNLKKVLAIQEKILDKAIDKAQEGLKMRPENPALHYNLGSLYQKKGKLDEAIDQYQKALSIQPAFTEALNNLAAVYTIQREYNKAITVFKKIIGLRPDSTGAHYNIACIYARQNRVEEATEWLSRAIEKGYNNWELIKTDKDLENIRGSAYYKELVRDR